MTAPLDIEMVVFDVLGTMVDEPGGIERGIREMVRGLGHSLDTPPRASAALDQRAAALDPQGLLEVWQRHVDEQQQEILAGRRPYADSTVIDLEAAERVATEAGTSDPDVVRGLAASAQRLDPWPDSVAALDRIASRLPVVGLSNARPSALTRISAHAGLRWHQALSADDARNYKPHPDVYRLAIANADCPPDRIVMVAAHAWDLRGAQAVGMRTAYVERPVGDPPNATDSFDLYAKGLDELATRLLTA